MAPIIDKILADIETQGRAQRKAAWKRYRELLEITIDGGELSTDDRAEFTEVVKFLTLAPSDVRAHATSIEKDRQSLAAEAKAVAMEVERASLVPHVAEWQARRVRIVEEIDAEGAPMCNRVNEIELALLNMTWQRSLVGEQGRDFPELFGVETSPPAAPVEQSNHQLVQRQNDLAEHSTSSSIAGTLRSVPDDAGAVHRLSKEHRELLRKGVDRGWVNLSQTHLDALNEPAPAGPVRGEGGRFVSSASEG